MPRSPSPSASRALAALAAALVLGACAADARVRRAPTGVVPPTPRDAVAEGDLARGDGRLDDAIATYERAVAADRASVPAHLRLVAALQAAGRRSEAQARYAAAARAPGATEPERVLAARLATDGSSAELRRVYGDAARAAQGHAWWHLALAEVELADAEASLAEQARARASGDRPAAARALEGGREALARAQAAVDEAARRAPDLAEVHLYRGLLRSVEADALPTVSAKTAAYRAAAEAFERAVAADAALVDAWANLADARRRTREPDRALVAALAAARLAPSDPALRVAAGVALHDLGRHREAAEQLLEAARLDPTDAAPWIAAGDELASDGRLEEALDAYGRALALAPRRVEALARRGAVLERMGRPAQAREDYTAYLERGGPDEGAVRRRMERLSSVEAAR